MKTKQTKQTVSSKFKVRGSEFEVVCSALRTILHPRSAILSLLLLLPAAAQAQAIEAWAQRYNGPANGDDWVSALMVDTNGNVLVTGRSYGGDPQYGGSLDDWVTIKYSSAGVPLWTNLYNGPGNLYDSPAALAADASGNVYVAGVSYGTGSWSDWATIKYSSAGVPLWTNRYNGPANSEDHAIALAVDTSGNVIVTGDSYNGANYDYVTIKYSSAGVPLWTHRFNGPANDNDSAVACAVDVGGDVVVTGNSQGYLTIKYSSTGVLLWTNLYHYGGNDLVCTMALDSSGNVVVTGRSQATDTWLDYLTIKYSSAGVPLWTNRFNGPANGNDTPSAVAADASGNVYVTGQSGDDYGTIKYSSAGVLLWTNFYIGPARWDQPRALAVDASGNVFVTGQSDGPGIGYDEDYATVAYSSSGVPLWTNLYNGPSDKRDYGWAVAVDVSGSVFVTGSSQASGGDMDFATAKYVVPPVIARQPLSRTNLASSTASFTIEAVGGVPLSYQWRRQGTNLVNGGNLSGVTTTNLQIANVQFADAAGYTVVVTNAYGCTTSSVAHLTVYVPPNPGRFTDLAYSPAMGFSFIFRDATVGQPYRIQRSPSMAEGSWTNWQSFTYTEPTGFMDLGATGAERRFYRAVTP